ncbi:hypothetical protein FJR48_00570 [Sulfurimonas lithotrophica]|uniref:HNH endonuclease n=1 Tax=Sulfurimonas lithotrophica TaxID=2590022 RepID=A0A5P8NXY0_9BACT|nr:hypothetical protein [Sulfurimonas lithotrophica]QFR48295.1 hypothetical protein FJR48_00570 [Sulfurimonas lithotrophica]
MTKLPLNTKALNKHVKELTKKIEPLPSISKYTIKEILEASPEKLHEIAKWFDTLSSTKKEEFNYIKTEYSNFITKDKIEYHGYILAKKLNINVCPYCNRNYTFTVINDKEISRPEFDHFYSKEKYPILALSFYNLIPSCHICNSTLKGREEFSINSHIHPYLESFHQKTKFCFKPLNADFLHNHESIKIRLFTTDKKALNSKKTFKLDEFYEHHRDMVVELIQKSAIYNESYIDELFNRYEGTLFKNKEDLLRLITCGYITDEDINKRPLSKLIKDISEELKLI